MDTMGDTKTEKSGEENVRIVDGKFVCEECKEMGLRKDEYTHPISDVIFLGGDAPLICKECYSQWDADEDLVKEWEATGNGNGRE